MKDLNKVLCLSTQATKYVLLAWINPRMVFSYSVAVFATESNALSLVLHSSFHDIWVRSFTSNNLSLIRYTIANCFENFPFPFDPRSMSASPSLEKLGLAYHSLRQEVMDHRGEGLTDIYNRFHNRGEQSEDITQLRALHIEMDQAVAAAYGWQDLDLDQGFQETKQGIRYTISETARREVLDRLLALNHQRHAEEEAQQPSQSAVASAKRGPKKSANITNTTPGLFD